MRLCFTTAGRCWPGFLELHNSEVSVSKGGMLKYQTKKYFYRRICAIMPLTREFGFKSSNLGGFSPGPKVPKSIL
jgi:hypothetical protein